MSITFSNVVEQHLNTLNNTKKKRRCGRTEIIFPAEEKEYITKRSTEGWTPDVIIGRAERTFSCSVSTLYRRFKTGEFNVLHLPMQGKRKPNGYKEKRGKQAFKRNISERKKIMSFSKKSLDI